MNQQDGDAVGIRDPLQCREVAVVVGVGCVASRTNHLQRVDDDQYRVRMGSEECFHLLLQPLSNEGALRAEVDAAWCVLGDLKEPVLDTENGILQAEVESGALLHGHPPDRFALGYHDSQPQSQPGLSHLGRAGKDVQPLRQQRVQHEVEWCQRQAHQALTVDGLQSFCFTHQDHPLVKKIRTKTTPTPWLLSFHLIIGGILIK